jgi:23S rRNA (cytosine1962-C5)-methyltransferase
VPDPAGGVRADQPARGCCSAPEAFTCSCSQHLSEAELLQIVAQAALDTGRTLRVLERRTQAQDHPILLTVPETHYLKCLILQVV